MLYLVIGMDIIKIVRKFLIRIEYKLRMEYKMSNDENKSGKLRLTLLLALMGCFFIAILVYAMKEIKPAKKIYHPSTTSQIEPTQEPKEKEMIPNSMAVIKAVNTTDQSILCYDITKNLDVELTYTGASDITDKYNQVISISQIAEGEVVDIYYEDSDFIAQKIQKSTKAWEYRGVKNLRIDRTNSIMKIQKRNYQYTNKLYVRNLSEEINLLNINDEDELTLRGYESTIYSITVTKGHGSICLKEYDYFLGGTLQVGATEFSPITEDMVVTVREGNYNVTIEKDGVTGTKVVNVLRDEEVSLSMAEFVPEPEQTGYVTFHIIPFGASLYIDGTLTSYEKDVSLAYGEHKVLVTLPGYKTYEGSFDLETSSDVIQIELINAINEEEKTGLNTTGGENETTSNTTDGTSNGESMSGQSKEGEKEEEPLVDKNHSLYVKKPEGVSVYIDGIYKGIAPIKVEKYVGIHYITLLKEGYIQKTHTVNIEDDKEDKYFTFPNLELQKEDE